MTIHHIYLMVPKTKVAAMAEWYSRALAPLEYHIAFKPRDDMIALGPRNGWPNFWIRGHDGDQSVPTHVCFSVPRRDFVDDYHKAAVEAGGTDNGVPGIREKISVQPYYAAYVLDPEGNNVEVVWLGDKE